MASVETIRLVDDLTGSEADETVGFGLDGVRFEIDLSSAHADELRAVLAPFLAAARRPGDGPGDRRARARAASTRAASSRAASSRDGAPSGGSTASQTGGAAVPAGTEAATREHNQAVRAWARQNGFTVSERGRLPADVVAAHDRRTVSPGSPAAAEPGDPSGATASGDSSGSTERDKPIDPATPEPSAETLGPDPSMAVRFSG